MTSGFIVKFMMLRRENFRAEYWEPMLHKTQSIFQDTPSSQWESNLDLSYSEPEWHGGSIFQPYFAYCPEYLHVFLNVN